MSELNLRFREADAMQYQRFEDYRCGAMRRASPLDYEFRRSICFRTIPGCAISGACRSIHFEQYRRGFERGPLTSYWLFSISPAARQAKCAR